MQHFTNTLELRIRRCAWPTLAEDLFISEGVHTCKELTYTAF
jgi:hypothetical protein